jgi:hypothetical protein
LFILMGIFKLVDFGWTFFLCMFGVAFSSKMWKSCYMFKSLCLSIKLWRKQHHVNTMWTKVTSKLVLHKISPKGLFQTVKNIFNYKTMHIWTFSTIKPCTFEHLCIYYFKNLEWGANQCGQVLNFKQVQGLGYPN